MRFFGQLKTGKGDSTIGPFMGLTYYMLPDSVTSTFLT